jgi:hypothetical protein
MFLRQASGIPLEVDRASSNMFALSDSAAAILRLAAAHDGVSETALLTRLICQYGQHVGLPGLLDAAGDLYAVPDFERADVRRESG